MRDPATRRDIVSLGLVHDVDVVGSRIRVELGPPVGDAYGHAALIEAIRRELRAIDGAENVEVMRAQGGDPEREVHLPVLHDGATPETDHMNASLDRLGTAPEAGFGEAGPDQLPSPESPLEHDRYEGWPPVLQWEIDPTDASLVQGEGRARFGQWEYEVWWQVHPAGLVYASIQALQDDAVTGGPERKHPMGRNVVVNLVYDERREAVIAVYGTARDFRPFIEAFKVGRGMEQREQGTSA